jgi:hypothetical protein
MTFDPMTGAPITGAGMDGTAVCDSMSPMHGMVSQMYGLPAGSATVGMCVELMQTVADAALAWGDGGAAQVGMNDGIAGLQGFIVRETSKGNLEGCDPFVTNLQTQMGMPYQAARDINGDGHVSGQEACMTHSDCAPGGMYEALAPYGCLLYSRNEVRSHYRIDFQQSYTTSSPASGRVTWPVPISDSTGHAAGYDAAQMCQDQGVSTGNPFAPKMGPCVGGDGAACTVTEGPQFMGAAMMCQMGDPSACAAMASFPNCFDDILGMDGQHHIVVNIPGNAYLKYNDTKLKGLMWANAAPASTVPDTDGDNVADNTTLNARLSATTAWNRNGAGDVVLLPNAIAVDATGSVCNNNDGTPTTCTYSWTLDGVAYDLGGAGAGTIAAAPGLHSVTVTITRADGFAASKTLQAAASAADDVPAITGSNVTNNGDCTATVDVTATNATTLLVNCGNGKALVSANFAAGAASAVCDYTNAFGACVGTEAAIIAIARDADNDMDSETVDPEYNPQP